MNGWQRFGILFLCCFIILVLFPNYGAAGWVFIGLCMLMWTGVILLISLVSNVFGLDRFDWLNRLLALVLLCGFMYTLLWYFPQEDKVVPINKLKYGEYPTQQDIKQGIGQLTFHFNFKTRGVHDRKTMTVEDINKAKKELEKTTQQIKKEAQSFIEIVEEKTDTDN